MQVAPYPAASGNTLTLRSGEGADMPAVPFNAVAKPKNMPARFNNTEIVRVTARDGDTLTFDREAEGTEAKNIGVGWDFYAGFTAKTLDDIYAAINASSADKHYTQQFTALSSVTVTHNLGKYPAVTVLNSAGDEVRGDIDHVSINELVFTSIGPFTSRIICN